MTYNEIHPVMRQFMGGWEAFRRLGFKADDLYCLISMSARHRTLSCFVQLKAQGKEFNLEVGAVEDGKTFGAEYKRVTKAVAAGEVSQEDMDRMWQESEAFEKKVLFLHALLSKGFKVPKSAA